MAQNAPDTGSGGFDPSRYLSKVGGSEYLEVKWRLVWLRDVAPDAVLETQAVSIDEQMAVFRAKITLPTGGSATGYGSETPGDFRDYIEKSETKAIGRALAALGFGTQFTPDFDFGGGSGKVVDAPIEFASTRGRRMNDHSGDDASRQIASVNQTATPRQLKFLRDIATELGIDDGMLAEESEQAYGRPIAELNRKDASAFIERLQARKAAADFPNGAAETPTQTATAREVAPGRAAPPPRTPDATPRANAAPEGTQRSTDPNARTPGGASVRSLNYSLVLMGEAGQTDDDVHTWIQREFGATSRNDLNQAQMSQVIEWLQAEKDHRHEQGASAPPAPDDDEPTALRSWSEFWKECRELGVKSPADFEARVGAKQTAYPSPAAALAALKGSEQG